MDDVYRTLRSHEIAQRKLAEIPNDVVVWYEPEKPSEAYLRKHTPTMGVLIVVFGVLLSLGVMPIFTYVMVGLIGGPSSPSRWPESSG